MLMCISLDLDRIKKNLQFQDICDMHVCIVNKKNYMSRYLDIKLFQRLIEMVEIVTIRQHPVKSIKLQLQHLK